MGSTNKKSVPQSKPYKIKQNNNNKTNLYQYSSTYTQYMRPTAINPKRKNKHQYKDISLIMVCKD